MFTKEATMGTQSEEEQEPHQCHDHSSNDTDSVTFGIVFLSPTSWPFDL